MVTLHLRLEQFISGFKIFGVAIWAQVTLNVLDAPVEVTTPEIIDKIHDMVMDDRRVKVREIASAVGISNERGLLFCRTKDDLQLPLLYEVPWRIGWMLSSPGVLQGDDRWLQVAPDSQLRGTALARKDVLHAYVEPFTFYCRTSSWTFINWSCGGKRWI
uniref:Uncharacterized protein n=2 Tax=Rhodnius prolixus TaxID=13249 RepID=T1HRN4_RHOPR